MTNLEAWNGKMFGREKASSISWLDFHSICNLPKKPARMLKVGLAGKKKKNSVKSVSITGENREDSVKSVNSKYNRGQ